MRIARFMGSLHIITLFHSSVKETETMTFSKTWRFGMIYTRIGSLFCMVELLAK